MKETLDAYSPPGTRRQQLLDVTICAPAAPPATTCYFGEHGVQLRMSRPSGCAASCAASATGSAPTAASTTRRGDVPALRQARAIRPWPGRAPSGGRPRSSAIGCQQARPEARRHGFDKPPIDLASGNRISLHAAACMTLDEAWDACDARNQQQLRHRRVASRAATCRGLAALIGADFDACIGGDGSIAPGVAEIIALNQTYAEKPERPRHPPAAEAPRRHAEHRHRVRGRRPVRQRRQVRDLHGRPPAQPPPLDPRGT